MFRVYPSCGLASVAGDSTHIGLAALPVPTLLVRPPISIPTLALWYRLSAVCCVKAGVTSRTKLYSELPARHRRPSVSAAGLRLPPAIPSDSTVHVTILVRPAY